MTNEPEKPSEKVRVMAEAYDPYKLYEVPVFGTKANGLVDAPFFPGWVALDPYKVIPDKSMVLVLIDVKPITGFHTNRNVRSIGFTPYSGEYYYPTSANSMITGDIDVIRLRQIWGSVGMPNMRVNGSCVYAKRPMCLPDDMPIEKMSSVVWQLTENLDDIKMQKGDILFNAHIDKPDKQTIKEDDARDLLSCCSSIIIDEHSGLIGEGFYFALAQLRGLGYKACAKVYRPIIPGPYGIAKRIPMDAIFSQPSPLP